MRSERVEDGPGRLNDAFHEILDDLEANSLAGVEVYIARVPDLAEEIARFHADAVARHHEHLTGVSDARDEVTAAGADVGLGHVGPYRLLRVIGRGGQGVVYLAEKPNLPRRVALKVLAEHALVSGDSFRRFQREAQITSLLEHPGICPVYEAGSEQGLHYIAMRFIDGVSLSERIRKRGSPPDHVGVHGPATWKEIADDLLLLERVARALHAAHTSSVIHRDIKPGNILVGSDGQPVIVDFGLARTLDATTDPVSIGDALGTPQYMSPEQVVGLPLDVRTDVYSLGVTLYEVLTGRRPFEGVTPEALHHEIQVSAPTPLRVLNPAIPKELAVVVETCLQKERNHRYGTALGLAEDLRRVRERQPIRARPTPLIRRSWRWFQSHRALGTTLVIAFVILAAGFAVSSWLAVQRNAALVRVRQETDSSVVNDLKAQEQALWPRRPQTVAQMQKWLARADDVQGRLAEHETSLSALRVRALPYDDQQKSLEGARRKAAYPEFCVQLEQARTDVEISRDYLHAAETPALRSERSQGTVEAEARLAKIEGDPLLRERLIYTYVDPQDQERDDALASLVRALRSLPALTKAVRERLAFTESLVERTVRDVAAKSKWEKCIADVARPDSPYHGLVLQPHAGLLPLGVDERSGLWEFWLVESGDRPRWEPTAEGQLRGSVQLDDDTGIVLVLLPGGIFDMGASVSDAVNLDPWATETEGPVHSVSLSAFFVGKYEVTQRQWMRLMGENPSGAPAGRSKYLDKEITARHPVESISWAMTQDACRRWGLVLPTEAQWEYACRAGTHTAFWCGATLRSIQDQRAGNILDTVGHKEAPQSPFTEEVTDGYVLHAPVGSFAPNRFGLHDVLGNVREFCRDGSGSYRTSSRLGPKNGDVESDQGETRKKIVRGGSFKSTADKKCSSGARDVVPLTYFSFDLGFRVALSVQRAGQ